MTTRHFSCRRTAANRCMTVCRPTIDLSLCAACGGDQKTHPEPSSKTVVQTSSSCASRTHPMVCIVYKQWSALRVCPSVCDSPYPSVASRNPRPTNMKFALGVALVACALFQMVHSMPTPAVENLSGTSFYQRDGIIDAYKFDPRWVSLGEEGHYLWLLFPIGRRTGHSQ